MTIPFELYLIWQDEDAWHINDLADWQDHVLPGTFYLYVDAYPATTSHWNAEELAKCSYELHAEQLPAGFVASVLSLSTYEEVVGYLSAQAQGLTPDLPTWIEQDWLEIPLHGFPQEKQDWAVDWMNVVCPGMPENFDVNWLDADYIIREFLRVDTNEWYEDPVTSRAWYR